MIGKIYPETFDGNSVSVLFDEGAYKLTPDDIYTRLESGLNAHGLTLQGHFHRSKMVIIRDLPHGKVCKIGAAKKAVENAK